MPSKLESQNITFWQNSLSIHQAPLIKELASRPGNKIRVVAEKGISNTRRKQGWDFPDYGLSEVIVEPDKNRLDNLLVTSRFDDAHIFSGIGVYPMVEYARSWLADNSSAKMIAQTESIDTRTLLRRLRFMSKRYSISKHINEYDTVLACGEIGVKQWSNLSKNKEQIREFGYFVDVNSRLENHQSPSLNVLFIGSLISRKNPELLIRALYQLPDINWKAKFIGKGPVENRLTDIARKLGIRENIDFVGNCNNHETIRYLQNSDVLVLPSTHDGWGAVVNEALIHGTRAIVSDKAGSSTLICHSALGATFSSGNLAQLINELRRSASIELDTKRRNEIASWADKSISPRAAGNYLMKIIGNSNTEYILPPWKDKNIQIF